MGQPVETRLLRYFIADSLGYHKLGVGTLDPPVRSNASLGRVPSLSRVKSILYFVVSDVIIDVKMTSQKGSIIKCSCFEFTIGILSPRILRMHIFRPNQSFYQIFLNSIIFGPLLVFRGP